MPGLAERALRLIRERYADFGPTLAYEKLAEVHGLYLAKETVRKLMQLLFVSSESTFTYRDHLERYSKPLAFYSDKASVFRINNKQATGGDGQTEFGNVMNELNITGICANTSCVKERLVKELRLRGISTPELQRNLQ